MLMWMQINVHLVLLTSARKKNIRIKTEFLKLSKYEAEYIYIKVYSIQLKISFLQDIWYKD